MNGEVCNRSLVSRLQHILDTYDIVLLVRTKEEFYKCLESVREIGNRNLLLLLPEVFKDTFEKFGLAQQILTANEFEEIESLYRMYEFSNRFRVISDDGMYGDIFEFVNNGLLTYEEALEAILR